MKRRCQCPKPDQMKVDPYTMDVGGYVIPILETDLHFKAADRECERCGAALCAECGVKTGTLTFIPYDKTGETFQLVDEYICRTCAELQKETYTCFFCQGVFLKGWSDKEAAAELHENFPGWEKGQCDIVCDDCYKKYMDPSNE